jgi:hypothetical protein
MAIQQIQPRDIPIFRKWEGKIGKVLNVVTMPMIGVYAFWRYVPFLAWRLLKPDPKDAVLNRFGKGHRLRRRWTFSADDIIKATEPHPKGLGWAWFKLGSAAQRVGWYILVIDATLDFVVDWTSAVYQWGGCPFPATAYVTAQGNGQVWGPPAEEKPFTSWQNAGSIGYSYGFNALNFGAGQAPSVAMSLNGKPQAPFFEAAGGYSVTTRDILSGQELFTLNSQLQPNGTQRANGVWTGYNWDGLSIGVEAFITASGPEPVVFDGDSTWSAYGNQQPTILRDP